MSRYLLIFLLMCSLHVARGQDSPVYEGEFEEATDAEEALAHELIAPGELGTTRQYREQPRTVQEFDRDKWKAVVGGEDYSQEKLADAPEWKPISMSWLGPVLKVISYVVIIGLVIYLIYYITKNITFDHKIERNRLRADDLERPVENIDSLDIEALIEQARKDGNFRMVIRLYYLGLLKRLNARGIIAWKKDKTNRDYLSELFSKDFRYREMTRLTASYEAVWYGEHTLKGESLERLAQAFEATYRELDISRAT